ncbi:hypothetical protein RN001_009691 [Aquatica leii]|uniref:Uncharacterized protein n=1 Tax=Aquatica leii TaxID=1421715 RepID=A0AAN7SQ14_9COLE|nr:hypothetical protein RN001_009691 [Aquatica leii]
MNTDRALRPRVNTTSAVYTNQTPGTQHSVSPLMAMETQATTNQNNAASSTEPSSPMEPSTVTATSASETATADPMLKVIASIDNLANAFVTLQNVITQNQIMQQQFLQAIVPNNNVCNTMPAPITTTAEQQHQSGHIDDNSRYPSVTTQQTTAVTLTPTVATQTQQPVTIQTPTTLTFNPWQNYS